MKSHSRANGPRVLVVDGSSGQNRSALAAVRALGSAGYRVHVTTSGRHSLAAASRFCAGAVPTAAVGAPDFVADVHRELGARDYLTMVPASDAAIVALDAPGKALVDKTTLPELARAAGLLMPQGREHLSLADLREAVLDYPSVVKTSVKTGLSVLPARLLTGPQDLAALNGVPGPFIVQPFVAAPMHSICGVMWRGRLVVRLHQEHLRLWPPTCGDTCAAVTNTPDLLVCERLEELLGDYEGVFQAEFAGDQLLDVNPRVYASMPLATAAGANLLADYCARLQGNPGPSVSVATGVGYHWWEGELRHLATSARNHRRVSGPLWLGGRRSASLRTGLDPLPTLARLRYTVGALTDGDREQRNARLR